MFASTCGDCDGRIESGDEIARAESGAWVHVVCPAPVLELRRPVCQVCWTEVSVSGACMCGAVS